MSYVDFFCLPLQEERLDDYRKMAEIFASFMTKQGLLTYCEAIADDVPKGKVTDFYRSVQATEKETVVAAYCTWPDKVTRDKAWENLMKDPKFSNMNPEEMAFDGKRMFWGGFKPFIEIDNQKKK